MSGHSKWANIKHKKKKPTLKRARYSQRSAVKYPYASVRAGRIRPAIQSLPMLLQRQRPIICPMTIFSVP